MKSNKLWMAVFLIPAFALLQIAVIHVYREAVKEEMYEGVVTTEEKDYACGYDRMNAVMEHATLVELSSNLQTVTLNWIGPGEKKGICHMLVNDEKLSWIEGD